MNIYGVHHEVISLMLISVAVGGNGAVRLVGGAKSTEGRLEILIDGVWGTVCNDEFDTFAAMVVCKQLGTKGSGESFTSVVTTFSILTLLVALSEVVANVSFGAGPSSQPIHLDEVLCTGNEDNLLGCIHDGIGAHDCSHREDVGIICERSRGKTYFIIKLLQLTTCRTCMRRVYSCTCI